VEIQAILAGPAQAGRIGIFTMFVMLGFSLPALG
jgi:hypothetical protein